MQRGQTPGQALGTQLCWEHRAWPAAPPPLRIPETCWCLNASAGGPGRPRTPCSSLLLWMEGRVTTDEAGPRFPQGGVTQRLSDRDPQAGTGPGAGACSRGPCPSGSLGADGRGPREPWSWDAGAPSTPLLPTLARRRTMRDRRPMSMSVYTLRSWASSMITTLYLSSRKSWEGRPAG